MAHEIKPQIQSLPATTGIQDPAARNFANAVEQALRAGTSGDRIVNMFIAALGGGAGGGAPLGGPLGGKYGISEDMISDILRSELWQALGRAIEQVPIPTAVANKIAALETGVTETREIAATANSMTVTAVDALVSRVGGVEAGVYSEAKTRAQESEALVELLSGAIARIGTAEAGLQEEITVRATADQAAADRTETIWAQVAANSGLIQNNQTAQSNWNSAYAQAVTTLQGQVRMPNGELLTNALQQEAITRANADGDLYAQYTVKIDQNGYVSGYGLASEARVSSTPRSRFIVRADSFVIGAPQYANVPDKLPFAVYTTTTPDGRPPGVYMDYANIADVHVRSAQIDFAQINTLHLEGEAVTVPRSQSYPSVLNAGTDWRQYGEIVIPAPKAIDGIVPQIRTTVTVKATVYRGTEGSRTLWEARLMDPNNFQIDWGGAYVDNVSDNGIPARQSMVLVGSSLATGSYRLFLRVDAGTATASHISYIAIGTKR